MRRKMTPTGNLTREEWLQLRRNGIGGSDASVIMGKNPYRSILQLWEEKQESCQFQIMEMNLLTGECDGTDYPQGVYEPYRA